MPAFLFEFKGIRTIMISSREETINTIEELINPILNRRGLELYDVDYMKGILRIYIDKETGVTISDCSDVSRELGVLLDIHDVIPSSYRLEVSSPGLNRALKKPDQFLKYKGKKVRIKTKENLYDRKVFVGRLRDYFNDVAYIDIDGESFNIPFYEIVKANLELDY